MKKDDIIEELYQEFTSPEVRNVPRKAMLSIKGFETDMYLDYYQDVLERLQPFFLDDFIEWYETQVKRCYRWKLKSSKSGDVYLPQYLKPIEEQNAQERLYIFKFFVSRRFNSGFGVK